MQTSPSGKREGTVEMFYFAQKFSSECCDLWDVMVQQNYCICICIYRYQPQILDQQVLDWMTGAFWLASTAIQLKLHWISAAC